jgi:hypothetical protein
LACIQQLSANRFRESPDNGIGLIDGTYDIAGGQELEKFRRESEVAFGPVDTVKYAGAFGATGLMIRTPDEIAPALKRAIEIEGPVLIGRARRLPRQSRALVCSKQHRLTAPDTSISWISSSEGYVE